MGWVINLSVIFRTQSVRRTSLREKILTTKKDAVEEARLRLRAQEVGNYWGGVMTEGSMTILDYNGLGNGDRLVNERAFN